MKKIYIYIAAALITTFATSSCSQGNKETSYPKSRDEQEADRIGYLAGKDGLVLFGGSGNRGKSTADAINVNGYLWRAALDSVYFMPLLSADPFGGTILTDWHSSKVNSNERLKFNIFITTAELRSDSVKVSVFRQVKDAQGNWRDADANQQLAREIEDKILLRARAIKVNSL